MESVEIRPDQLCSPLIELEKIHTLADLAGALIRLQVRAGRPSRRQIVRDAKLKKPPLTRTSLDRLLNGERLPSKEFVLALVAHLDNTENLQGWDRAWQQVAMAQGDVRLPAARGELAQLREEVDHLHQLVAAQQQAIKDLTQNLDRAMASIRQQDHHGSGDAYGEHEKPVSSRSASRLSQGRLAWAVQSQVEGMIPQVARETARELTQQVVRQQALRIQMDILSQVEGSVKMMAREATKSLVEETVAKARPKLEMTMLSYIDGAAATIARDAVKNIARNL